MNQKSSVSSSSHADPKRSLVGSLKPGSLWRRWDPHIHSPETVLNNQFKGKDAWDDYFTRLENLSPSIEAVGLTDYYILDTYEKTVAAKETGRLSNIGLIFPNIELRLAVTATQSKPVNFHLLIAPDDPDHIIQTKRFLARLEFRVPGETYHCRREDLIRLGYAHDNSAKSDKVALEVGVNQFKIEIDQFIAKWDESDWIKDNALIAVATSSNDGTSSLQKDSSLAALRQKIERMAHIMFASNPRDRLFWLGQSKLSPEEIRTTYGGLKLCLHGSDAHEPVNVGKPDKDRYSWIKGDLTFDTLRQACMEPELRAFVGLAPPSGPAPSLFIKFVSVKNGTWFAQGSVPLNSGLVGIIGARGSGKTALVDMIAAGGYSLSGHMNERSFVNRARDFFEDDEAVLVWGDGETTKNHLKHVDIEDIFDEPHVQYLSQQFVETLCSSDGVTDELVLEIERVIFAAHSPENRQGTTGFRELMDAKAAIGRQKRTAFERSILQTGELIEQEREKRDGFKVLEAKIITLQKDIDRDERAKKSLVTKDSEAQTELFNRVSTAIELIRQRISQLEKQKGALELLKAYVDQHRTLTAIAELRSLSTKYAHAAFETEEWNYFLTDFVGDVDKLLNDKLTAVQKEITTFSGPAVDSPVEQTGDGSSRPAQTTLLPSKESLENVPLNTLIAEAKRLEVLISIDEGKRKQFINLTKKIANSRAELAKLETQLKEASGAQGRIDKLMKERNAAYAGVFEGILAEEAALRKLYEPLSAQLESKIGAVAKLSVSIKRHVDVESWAKRGEELLDLRRADSFYGRGALLAAAKSELQIAWESGTAEDVADAMAGFQRNHRNKIIKGALYESQINPSEYRQWMKDISQWIYSTGHIRVTYNLQYDGLDIERLSPGTRGIVLLLLYLAIDQDDERPLIIDQPEENLDPKSIFDELVSLLRIVKLRRQIIIVTHNANLIVNADADQVIVATCGPHKPHDLPRISYQSGGLENSDIRKHVCDILEGGENAFKERAKRLRVKFMDR